MPRDVTRTVEPGGTTEAAVVHPRSRREDPLDAQQLSDPLAGAEMASDALGTPQVAALAQVNGVAVQCEEETPPAGSAGGEAEDGGEEIIEGITRFEGRTPVYAGARARGKPLALLERGTDVMVVEMSAPGWRQVIVEGGPHKGKEGYIQTRYLEREIAPEEFKPKYEKANVVLFQGADNDPNPSKTDIKQRRYFVNTAKNLASARKNTIGCNLESGMLIEGEPIEYNTGQDIVQALKVIGQALAGQPLKTTEEGPVYAKIGEVHILGHASAGIYGSEHKMAGGLYTDEVYEDHKQSSKDFVAKAPQDGRITKLLYGQGQTVNAFVASEGGGDADNIPLFEMAMEGDTSNASAPISFPADDFNRMADVIEVMVAAGAEVKAGDPVLKLRALGSLTGGSAKLGDLEPTFKAYFAKDVKIGLHGCALASPDEADPFAEKMFDLAKSALGSDSEPVVIGRPHVGDTRSTMVRIFSDKAPEGSGVTTSPPRWFRVGLKK